MGYFDGLADAVFKKDLAGNTLFYPFGVMGSGYVLESDDQRALIRTFYKKMYMVMLPTIVVVQVAIGWWLNVALLPVFYVWYYFYAKKITKRLTKSAEKLKVSEAYKNSAKSHNLTQLIFLELISIGFVAIGFWILLTGRNQFIALSSIGFFGLCGVAIGYMIFAKIRSK